MYIYTYAYTSYILRIHSCTPSLYMCIYVHITTLYYILYCIFKCINTYTYIIRYILTCFCYASWNVDSTKTHSLEAMPGTWNCVCSGRRRLGQVGWEQHTVTCTVGSI